MVRCAALAIGDKMSLREADIPSVLLLAEDMTEEGRIRTRITGEPTAPKSALSFGIVFKVRARNLPKVSSLTELSSSPHPGAI